VLEWVLARQPDPATLARAQAIEASLERGSSGAAPVFLLAMWQASAASYLAGPHLAYLSWDPSRSATPYFLGAAAGALVGGGAALYLGLGPGLDGPQALTIFSSEVIGGANGVLIGNLADDETAHGRAIGVLAGTGLGAAGGHLLAFQHPSVAEALALPSGAFWGTGLAVAGVLLVDEEEPFTHEVPLLVGLDLGAAGAVLAARLLDLSPAQVALFDLGGLVGASAAGLALGLAVVADADPTVPTAVVIVTVSSLGAGVAGAALGARLGDKPPAVSHALVSGQPGDLHLALPLPHLQPVERAAGVGLTLVDCRF
jgi:hypothetical protein